MTTSDEAFCHDHIQHPLMWCDEKRRLVERKNAEESMRMWRRRKTEELARKEKDKQEVSLKKRPNETNCKRLRNKMKKYANHLQQMKWLCHKALQCDLVLSQKRRYISKGFITFSITRNSIRE